MLYEVITVVCRSVAQREMIKMMDNNMEVKLAPLASTQYIKYSDIDKVERVNEKKIFVHYKAGDKTKKLRVPVHMMEPKDSYNFV